MLQSYNSHTIRDTLPYKYPFILIDKIVQLEPREHIVCTKNVTETDPWIQAHFTNNPCMPESLIIESILQSASVLLLKDMEFAGRVPHIQNVQKFKFSKTVCPGDQLRIEVTVKKIKENEIIIEGSALVDGEFVTEGTLTFALNPIPSKPQIHPTAFVHPSAILGKDVSVGAYSNIGENVIIGDNTIIESHCNIERWTRIGDHCHIYFGAVIGSAPQDMKYKGEKTWVVIGDHNEIREYVTINRSTGKNNVTTIGNNNIFLTSVHIGHNCQVGNNIIITNMSNIAGHSIIEDRVTIGGMAGVHQFCRIGKGSMIGAYTRVTQDIIPFMLCDGNPALIRNINLVGLKRNGVSSEGISELKEIYKLLFRSSNNTSQALDHIKENKFNTEESKLIIHFLENKSLRGITKN